MFSEIDVWPTGYGAKCPVCFFMRMISRLHGLTRGEQDLQYDACPKCGFGYGEFGDLTKRVPIRDENLWRIIIFRHRPALERTFALLDLTLNRDGYAEWVMTWPQPFGNIKPVFSYDVGLVVDSAIKLGILESSEEFRLISQRDPDA